MDLISVIVPVYNAEKSVERCLKSIIKQSYKNLEIIIINDGSTDKSLNICEKFYAKDSRIRIICQENGGVSKARNTGISSMSGEYVIMIDSDDYMTECTIEKLYNEILLTNADLALCDFENGSEENYSFTISEKILPEIINNRQALKRIYVNNHNALQYVAPWGKLYKKELFKDILYPDGKIFEDIYVTHRILQRCKKIVVVPQKMFYYFEGKDSIMHKEFHIGKIDYLEALKQRIFFFKECGYNDLVHIAYDEYLHSLIWEYSRVRDILKNKKAMKDIKERFREIYQKGYASQRYSDENKRFLTLFCINPEIIILYWKIKGKVVKK